MCPLLLTLLAALILVTGASAGELRSDDAVIRWRGDAIELETVAVRHRLDLSGGALRRTEWAGRDRSANLLAGRPAEDFSVDLDGQRVSSATPGWTIGAPECERLSHGELRLRLPLRRDGVTVTRCYVLYPGLSLVRGWLEIANAGGDAVAVSNPPIASLDHGGSGLDLLWMSGAEQAGDSWRLRTEGLALKPRVFDSFDPPVAAAQPAAGPDGVEARILVNGRPVWPAEGWAHSAHAGDVQTHEVTAELKAGDQVMFVLGRHHEMTCDTTEWDPVVSYDDGAAFRASEGFSTEQGKAGWSYLYLGDDGQVKPLTYADVPGRYGHRWRLDPAVIEPFVSADEMHPDPRGCAVRAFTAPRAGHVTIRGALRNTGNAASPGAGFRLGTQTYAPWFCVKDPRTGLAAYVGFDCMAHWHAEFHPREAGGTAADVRLAGYSRRLQPGESIRTPYAFTGLFHDDLDDMGQELLEWQYRYLWDYTREPWFPAIRMLGYWMKGTKWGEHGWVGGDPDMESAFRKVFRTADFMRSVGGDTYHRDWGWWDRAGDWNGPDFGQTGDYLRKYGMGQLIYAFIYTVDGQSSVAQGHPEWLADPGTLDQSLPAVVDYEVKLLDSFCRRWGPFQWRNDSGPLSPRQGDQTVLLHQQQGFMEVLRRFLDAHPDCAFQGVNGGGFALNWEYLAYGSGFQFTDGQSGPLANYYASYLFPPDKINNMPDIWDPDKYDPATWRGLLCSNFDLTGDTFDPAKLEGLRDLCDVYHYLQSRGVVGRWVRVYHPTITGDDPTMYLQRLAWDRQRGLIITKHRIAGTVTIRPKGLLPEAQYEVGFHESPETFSRTGSDLMAEGIRLTDPAPGELIYLNLPDHPGNKLDRTPPSVPAKVHCAPGRNMGVPGVEVTWEPATDDHWLSHYQVLRDGELLERVAKGCFYFDHSLGADPAARYEVKAVDGSGNVSASASTPATSRPRRLILDDADPAVVRSGPWQQMPFPQAHRETLAVATAQGAGFTVQFAGRSVVWHSRLGAEGGLARVTVDGEAPVTVSCYAADEIPGWPLFERTWPQPGQHTLTVEVLGQPDERGAGAAVWLDGVSVEP
jgi:hypothetical protein